jgi:hypothetical protein
MKKFILAVAVVFILSFSVSAFAEAPELIPTEKIPSGAGELISVSTFGSKADYCICYTFKDPYGEIVTYVYQVGGARVTSASDLRVFLSHIIRPTD